MDKINLCRVQKNCLISFAGNQYSVLAEYVGKDVAVDAGISAFYQPHLNITGKFRYV